jgi:hypothetical protein
MPAPLREPTVARKLRIEDGETLLDISLLCGIRRCVFLCMLTAARFKVVP